MLLECVEGGGSSVLEKHFCKDWERKCPEAVTALVVFVQKADGNTQFLAFKSSFEESRKFQNG